MNCWFLGQGRVFGFHRGVLTLAHTHDILSNQITLTQRRFKVGKKRNEQTSKSVASKAAKILNDPKATKEQKSVAASALTQAPNRKKKTKK